MPAALAYIAGIIVARKQQTAFISVSFAVASRASCFVVEEVILH